jgi:hypothetical protein
MDCDEDFVRFRDHTSTESERRVQRPHFGIKPVAASELTALTLVLKLQRQILPHDAKR